MELEPFAAIISFIILERFLQDFELFVRIFRGAFVSSDTAVG